MNRINQKLQEEQKLLSIYFTAGYPELEDTEIILEKLQNSGVDMVEIGLPFSDPLADGPTIQQSGNAALRNGMTTNKLFDQLGNIREKITIPLIIMGYFNPILQYGVDKFCRKCKETGIDGLIIPDLPIEEYETHYKHLFEKNELIPIFLITPQTPDERIRFIDSASNGFIYMVSSASVTGSTADEFGAEQMDYFKRIAEMDLETPTIVGFGINSPATFKQATQYSKGAIIGSAFIKFLSQHGTDNLSDFVKVIR